VSELGQDCGKAKADCLADSAAINPNNPLIRKNGVECARLMQTLEQGCRELVEKMSKIGQVG
jgi:hypothetical protein